MRQLFVWISLSLSLSAQGVLVVRAGRAHLGTGEILSPAVIVLEGGKIAAIGKDVPIPASTRVVDLPNAVVTPGFVDGLSYSGLARGAGENEESREVTPAARIADFLDRDAEDLSARLRTGVTTLSVNPGARNVIGGLTAVVKPGGPEREPTRLADAAALRITLGNDPAAGNRSPSRGGLGLFGRRPNSRMGVVYMVREAFAKAKVRAAHAATAKAKLDDETAVLLRALDGSLPVHWLAREAKDIYTALRIADELGIPNNVILDGHEAGDAVAELAARKVPVLFGPLFHAQYGNRSGGAAEDFPLPNDGTGAAEAADHEADAAGHDHAAHDPLVAARRAERRVRGIEFPLDSEEELLFQGELDCCCAPGLKMVQEEQRSATESLRTLFGSKLRLGFAVGSRNPGDTLLDFARFAVRAGLDPARAIPMLTLEPARILGVASRVGSLEVGKDADLVVFDGDPLSPCSAPRLVVVDGRIVFDAAPAKESRP